MRKIMALVLVVLALAAVAAPAMAGDHWPEIRAMGVKR